jgi:dTDP-4-dehydrorhamnose 3,5-epimerase
MKVTSLAIFDVLVIEPQVFEDERGLFYESFNLAHFERAIRNSVCFVQDNHSRSVKNVLRGLHYRVQQPESKLVRVTRGEIFDVAVDLRKGSDTFGRWVGEILSDENRRQLWIPEGFAHGYVVLSDIAEVLYKTTKYYAPEHEKCMMWNDATLGIGWPIDVDPILSEKDKTGTSFLNSVIFQ